MGYKPVTGNSQYVDALLNASTVSAMRSALGLPNQPDTTSLEIWLKLNEVSGTTAADSSGNSRNGTLVNGPTWNRDTRGNGNIVFDGTDDKVTLTGSVLTGLASGTIACWAKHSRAYNSSVTEVLWQQMDTGGVSPQLGFMHYATNELYIGWYTGGNDDRVQLTATAALWPQNLWTHYALTWTSGGTTTFYVNGISVGTAASTTPHPMAGGLTIGDAVPGAASTPYQGSVDDFRVYSRVLTATEVLEIVNYTP